MPDLSTFLFDNPCSFITLYRKRAICSLVMFLYVFFFFIFTVRNKSNTFHLRPSTKTLRYLLFLNIIATAEEIFNSHALSNNSLIILYQFLWLFSNTAKINRSCFFKSFFSRILWCLFKSGDILAWGFSRWDIRCGWILLILFL